MEFKMPETNEIKPPVSENFKEIKPESSLSPNEARQSWDNFFHNEVTTEPGEHLYTAREDRIACAKNSDGEWSGEPGNSKFTPTDKTDSGLSVRDTLNQNGVDGIEFKDGIPDFSPISVEAVSIDMTADRPENYSRAYTALADKWNTEAKDGRTDWTARDAKDWKVANQLSPHECNDMNTVMFVPMDVHDFVKHWGGVAECKARDHALGGGFDE
jgi:hypothetical protein